RRHPKVLGQRVDELLLGQVPELDEVDAEPPALLFLQDERLVELNLVDLAGPRQELPELVGDLRHCRGPAYRFRLCHASTLSSPLEGPCNTVGRDVPGACVRNHPGVYQPLGKWVNAVTHANAAMSHL